MKTKAFLLVAVLSLIIASSAVLRANVQAPQGLQQYIYNSPDNPLYVTGGASSGASGIAPISSSALEASHVLKASAGNLYSVDCTTTGTPGYLMVFNATSAPADGAVTPTRWAVAPASGTVSIENGDIPTAYSTGITVVFSTTGPFTKTGNATAAFSGRVQ